MTPLPWESLAEAHESLRDAERALEAAGDDFDRALAAARLEQARAEWDRAREHLTALGNLMLLFALTEPGSVAAKKMRELFWLATETLERRADAAHRRATAALNNLDALKCRVAELEEAVARLTPGVGEPNELRLVG